MNDLPVEQIAQERLNALGWHGILRELKDTLPSDDDRIIKIISTMKIIEPENTLSKAVNNHSFRAVVIGLLSTCAAPSSSIHHHISEEVYELLQELADG